MRTLRSLGIALTVSAFATHSAAEAATATTTVTASASGACENFVGACVVYGTGETPYTTTVYTDQPAPTSTLTATKTVTYKGSSPTATPSDACGDFVGACVVYATNTNGGDAYTTTVYSGTTHTSSGSDGIIGENGQGNNQGYIGSAPALSMSSIIPIILLAVVNLGFWVWM